MEVKDVLNSLKDSIAEYVIDKLQETASDLWDEFDETKRQRLRRSIRSCAGLVLAATLDESKRDVLKSDLKSALNIIGTDVTSTLLSARDFSDDVVVKTLFDIALSVVDEGYSKVND